MLGHKIGAKSIDFLHAKYSKDEAGSGYESIKDQLIIS